MLASIEEMNVKNMSFGRHASDARTDASEYARHRRRDQTVRATPGCQKSVFRGMSSQQALSHTRTCWVRIEGR